MGSGSRGEAEGGREGGGEVEGGGGRVEVEGGGGRGESGRKEGGVVQGRCSVPLCVLLGTPMQLANKEEDQGTPICGKIVWCGTPITSSACVARLNA